MILFDDREERILKNPRTIKSLPLKKSKASFEPAWIDLRSVKGILLRIFLQRYIRFILLYQRRMIVSQNIANNHLRPLHFITDNIQW